MEKLKKKSFQRLRKPRVESYISSESEKLCSIFKLVENIHRYPTIYIVPHTCKLPRPNKKKENYTDKGIINSQLLWPNILMFNKPEFSDAKLKQYA